MYGQAVEDQYVSSVNTTADPIVTGGVVNWDLLERGDHPFGAAEYRNDASLRVSAVVPCRSGNGATESRP